MRRYIRWPMTAMWLAMGLLVTLGFFLDARGDQARCEAGNELRRHDLPSAFNAYSDFLGHEIGAEQERVDEAKDRLAVVMDNLFPEEDCSLW